MDIKNENSVIIYSPSHCFKLVWCSDVQISAINKSNKNNNNTQSFFFLWFTGTLHRRNGFYTVKTACAIALHLPYT